ALITIGMSPAEAAIRAKSNNVHSQLENLSKVTAEMSAILALNQKISTVFTVDSRIDDNLRPLAIAVNHFSEVGQDYGFAVKDLNNGMKNLFSETSKDLAKGIEPYLDSVKRSSNPITWVAWGAAKGLGGTVTGIASALAQPFYRVGELGVLYAAWGTGNFDDGLEFLQTNGIQSMSGFTTDLLAKGNSGTLAGSWGVDLVSIPLLLLAPARAEWAALRGITAEVSEASLAKAFAEGTAGDLAANADRKLLAPKLSLGQKVMSWNERKWITPSLGGKYIEQPTFWGRRIAEADQLARDAMTLKKAQAGNAALIEATQALKEVKPKPLLAALKTGKEMVQQALNLRTLYNTAGFSVGQLAIQYGTKGKLGDNLQDELTNGASALANNLMFFIAMGLTQGKMLPYIAKVSPSVRPYVYYANQFMGDGMMYYMRRGWVENGADVFFALGEKYKVWDKATTKDPSEIYATFYNNAFLWMWMMHERFAAKSDKVKNNKFFSQIYQDPHAMDSLQFLRDNVRTQAVLSTDKDIERLRQTKEKLFLFDEDRFNKKLEKFEKNLGRRANASEIVELEKETSRLSIAIRNLESQLGHAPSDGEIEAFKKEVSDQFDQALAEGLKARTDLRQQALPFRQIATAFEQVDLEGLNPEEARIKKINILKSNGLDQFILKADGIVSPALKARPEELDNLQKQSKGLADELINLRRERLQLLNQKQEATSGELIPNAEWDTQSQKAKLLDLEFRIQYYELGQVSLKAKIEALQSKRSFAETPFGYNFIDTLDKNEWRQIVDEMKRGSAQYLDNRAVAGNHGEVSTPIWGALGSTEDANLDTGEYKRKIMQIGTEIRYPAGIQSYFSEDGQGEFIGDRIVLDMPKLHTRFTYNDATEGAEKGVRADVGFLGDVTFYGSQSQKLKINVHPTGGFDFATYIDSTGHESKINVMAELGAAFKDLGMEAHIGAKLEPVLEGPLDLNPTEIGRRKTITYEVNGKKLRGEIQTKSWKFQLSRSSLRMAEGLAAADAIAHFDELASQLKEKEMLTEEIWPNNAHVIRLFNIRTGEFSEPHKLPAMQDGRVISINPKTGAVDFMDINGLVVRINLTNATWVRIVGGEIIPEDAVNPNPLEKLEQMWQLGSLPTESKAAFDANYRNNNRIETAEDQKRQEKQQRFVAVNSQVVNAMKQIDIDVESNDWKHLSDNEKLAHIDQQFYALNLKISASAPAKPTPAEAEALTRKQADLSNLRKELIKVYQPNAFLERMGLKAEDLVSLRPNDRANVIKDKYVLLAKRYHPDVLRQRYRRDPTPIELHENEENMKLLTEANDYLSNESNWDKIKLMQKPQ
ncbi:MAG: hypothetical protein JWQ35_1929, partial [Bacteriovoracaceae bacterium]|nr:hypothetical protein [Bacteriovoracaceae bacterium]